jgi:hypothetical protein
VIANERKDRFAFVARIVVAPGQEVMAGERGSKMWARRALTDRPNGL